MKRSVVQTPAANERLQIKGMIEKQGSSRSTILFSERKMTKTPAHNARSRCATGTSGFTQAGDSACGQ